MQSAGPYEGADAGLTMENRFYVTDENFANRTEVQVYYEKTYGSWTQIGTGADNASPFAKEGIKGSYAKLTLTVLNRSTVSGSYGTKQLWNGVYRLPAQLYFQTMKGDALAFDPAYLIVRAEFCVDSGGKEALLYGNETNAAKGFCNRWVEEGWKTEYTKPTGGVLRLSYGDVFVFDLKHTLEDDYVVYGTR